MSTQPPRVADVVAKTDHHPAPHALPALGDNDSWSGPGGPSKSHTDGLARDLSTGEQPHHRYSVRYVGTSWGVYDKVDGRVVNTCESERWADFACRSMNAACDNFMKDSIGSDRHPRHDVEAIFTLIRKLDDAVILWDGAEKAAGDARAFANDAKRNGVESEALVAARVRAEMASETALSRCKAEMAAVRELIAEYRRPFLDGMKPPKPAASAEPLPLVMGGQGRPDFEPSGSSAT